MEPAQHVKSRRPTLGPCPGPSSLSNRDVTASDGLGKKKPKPNTEPD
jgi:hypothetical protein